MKRYIFLLLIGISLCSTIFNTQSCAQADKRTHINRILFVLDCSNSMLTKWDNKIKIEAARSTLIEVVDSLKNEENIEFALRLYGHQSESAVENCKDTRLEVAFSKSNEPDIIKKLNEIEPKGTTLIAYSLQATENDFPSDLNSRNLIILITDGLESCGEDPCAVSEALQKNKAILKPCVIGIGLKEDLMKQLECIGEAHNAKNEKHFKEIIWEIINRVVWQTSAQVNLLDSYNRPIETNVNMTFYDIHTGNVQYNLYHTMNVKGKPDILFLDPLFKYNIAVHTNPPVFKDNIEIIVKKHTDIPIALPQGNLVVTFKDAVSTIADDKIKYIVKKAGQREIIDVKRLNVETKYIVGKYDLEILTLPRIIVNRIDISQVKTTTISIPVPGRVNISSRYSGYGGVFVWEKNKLTKIFNFGDRAIHKILALLPGDYKVIFRVKTVKQSEKTIEKSFKIESNKSINVRLE
ncbi:MAG: VWA domain-containing protein [Cytophagales bacterium]|nr:VWA domain-containing protein [Cytophagales bacterium]